MKRCLLFVICYLWGSAVAFSAITAQVDSAKIQSGEAIRLTILVDNAQSVGFPNLTPLQKDFSIVSTERSMSYTMINGQSRSTMQWMIFLSPKKVGTLTIPAIRVGQEETQPLQIEVTNDAPATAQKTAEGTEDVFLKTEISSKNPYINQQVIYTVKLYSPNNQRLLDAEYKPPRVDHALLVPLGDGRRYQTIETGRTLNVEEQQYAIFPEKSGHLELISPALTALMFDEVPRRVTAQGNNIQLLVKPIPAQYSGKYWLPAQQLNLSQAYDKKETAFTEGTTIVRTLTLEATGVPAQLLPTLLFSSGQQFSVYPDKPEMQNLVQGKNLVGTSIIKVTYLFNQSGSVTIPALEIPWFNTITGKEELATLPPYTLKIIPKTPSATANASLQPASVEEIDDMTAQKNININVEPEPSHSNLAWGVAIGFVLAWVIAFGSWWFKSSFFSINRLRRARKKLRSACINNDAAQARSALLQWAAAQWPDEEFLNLNDLAHWIHNVRIKKQLALLSQALYGLEKKSGWQGKALWAAISNGRSKPTIKKYKPKDLPPINPI